MDDSDNRELPQELLPIPESFTCPIMHEIMVDPVCTCDGQTYERKAIETWLLNNNTSPLTNLPLPSRFLTPNIALKSAIDAWLKCRPELFGLVNLDKRDVALAVKVHEEEVQRKAEAAAQTIDDLETKNAHLMRMAVDDNVKRHRIDVSISLADAIRMDDSLSDHVEKMKEKQIVKTSMNKRKACVTCTFDEQATEDQMEDIVQIGFANGGCAYRTGLIAHLFRFDVTMEFDWAFPGVVNEITEYDILTSTRVWSLFFSGEEEATAAVRTIQADFSSQDISHSIKIY